MLVFDTNVLLYAVNVDSELHLSCRRYLDETLRDPAPKFLTWGICYEFLRISTHSDVFGSPLTAKEAWTFLEDLIEPNGSFTILTPTDRHALILAATLSELPEVRGSMIHDLHTAVLMREHGVSRICTRDTDFHRFPFLDVVDPLR